MTCCGYNEPNHHRLRGVLISMVLHRRRLEDRCRTDAESDRAVHYARRSWRQDQEYAQRRPFITKRRLSGSDSLGIPHFSGQGGPELPA